MDYSTGKLSFILLLAVALAWLGAWWLARRYRTAMRRLMSAPMAGTPASTAPPSDTDRRGAATSVTQAPRPLTAADNRRAGLRLAGLLVGLSALLALSTAALMLHVVMDDMEFSLRRLLVLAFAYLWPVIPALALLWRWSRWRLIGTMLLWFVLSYFVLLAQAIVPDPAQTLAFLAFAIGPALLIVSAVCMGSATRAIAPWLLLPVIGLVWASMSGIDLIAQLIDVPPRWFIALTEGIGAQATMALFALAPWLIAWWPLKRLGRWLAQAYTRKWLSELMVLFTATWAIVLTIDAVSHASSMGLGGVVMLLPLAWVPVLMLPLLRRSRQPAAGRAPTLLVLRVFQHDARIQALFDDVIERWRLTGNTVLIAGTDLVERTLGADDIFAFIDGRLDTRFIRRPEDVNARLAEFDLAPDAEGRHRINECYCHDSTWQAALEALVQRSDVVLMDLRSFKSHNEGCHHELGVLAHAPRLARVVVLTDGDTDRAAAQEAIAGVPAGRFVWLDTARIDKAKRREVLESLFVANASLPREPGPQAQSG